MSKIGRRGFLQLLGAVAAAATTADVSALVQSATPATAPALEDLPALLPDFLWNKWHNLTVRSLRGPGKTNIVEWLIDNVVVNNDPDKVAYVSRVLRPRMKAGDQVVSVRYKEADREHAGGFRGQYQDRSAGKVAAFFRIEGRIYSRWIDDPRIAHGLVEG